MSDEEAVGHGAEGDDGEEGNEDAEDEEDRVGEPNSGTVESGEAACAQDVDAAAATEPCMLCA